MTTCTRRRREDVNEPSIRRPAVRLAAIMIAAIVGGTACRADTVASLLGNFTINQFCGVTPSANAIDVHYAVVYGQLPALRELHNADADGNGVTTQAERDAYVGGLAPAFAAGLSLIVDGARVPLQATRWTSSLPTEQGGFSLRVDMDFRAALPAGGARSKHTVQFANQNFAGRIGWHEIAVTPAAGMAVFDSDAYATSATNGLKDALQALPEAGPLDERTIHMSIDGAGMPARALALKARAHSATSDATASGGSPGAGAFVPSALGSSESAWIARKTRELVDAISGPRLEPSVALWALLAALLLGAVHALSPGHGKTLVGAYLIGSRGTPRHAVFLGLTVTVTHTLGVFALGFATLYASRFIVPERLFPILSLISAVLVLGMGAWLLVHRGRAAGRALRPRGTRVATVFSPFEAVATGPGSGHGLLLARGVAHSHGDGTLHSHGGGPMHSHLPPGAAGEPVTWKSLLTLGISGGLVPCPSAMVLLLAAIALNKTAYGMLLVLVFSVGLAITLTAIGLLFLYARNRLRKPSSTARWPHVLPVVSAAFITVVGAALCYGALRSFS